MLTVSHSVLVPYTVDRVFEVVSEIEHYHQFLPGCIESGTVEEVGDRYEAFLTLRMFGVQERVVTLNRAEVNQSLKMSLSSGPFQHLEGEWQFKDLGEGCRVSLSLNCEFESRLASIVSQSVLARGIAKTIDAFVSEVRRREGSPVV